MLWLWITAAIAAEWGPARPYARPVITGGAVSVNGQTWVQATGGAQVGVVVRDRAKPHWYSHTRGSATGTIGLNSGSVGADLRVGSFIGPDGKLFRYLIGPDVFYNGYGRTDAPDYRIDWAPGVDLSNQLLFKLSEPLVLTGELTPGWVFSPERQSDQVAPFHQVDMLAAAIIRTKVIRITVGVRRTYNQAGVLDSLILAGAL